MTLVFTVDECYGLAFGKRRQSRDRELTKDLVRYANGRNIYAEEYSRLLFDEAEIDTASVGVSFNDDPLAEASGDSVILLELSCPDGALDLVDEVVIYLWNRRYPSTAKLDIGYIERYFSLTESVDFVGNSHEKLTRVTYKRK